MDRLTRKLLALLTAVALAVTLAPAVASADVSEESQFVSLINQSRSSAGLAPLSTQGDLISYARKHTEKMIAEGRIFHSSSAELSSATTGWSLLGENVGMGPDPALLHKAFMNSPSHRDNILGPFDRVGVGAERAPDGTLFVTVIFMQVAETETTTTTTTAPSTTTTAPATTTTTAPAVTTTTVAEQAPAEVPDEAATSEAENRQASLQPLFHVGGLQSRSVLWALELVFTAERWVVCIGPTHFNGLCIL